MLGVCTPDAVWFLGDAVASEHTFDKYKLTYLYDVEKFLQTLDTVAALEGKLFIPAHVAPFEDAAPVVGRNRRWVYETGDCVVELLRFPQTFEMLLKAVFDRYGLQMTFGQHTLLGATVARVPHLADGRGPRQLLLRRQSALLEGRGSGGGAVMFGPDPNAIHPNPAVPSVCFIKNTVTRPNIHRRRLHLLRRPRGLGTLSRNTSPITIEFLGDKLVIGKFCAVARGVTFIMNGANHRMCSATTYPFNIMGGGWEKSTPRLEDLPYKGDTVLGNDVWVGERVTFLPGARVGDGAIIGAGAVVAGQYSRLRRGCGQPLQGGEDAL